MTVVFHLQFEYYVTCAVCSRTGEKELQILKKFTQVLSVLVMFDFNNPLSLFLFVICDNFDMLQKVYKESGKEVRPAFVYLLYVCVGSLYCRGLCASFSGQAWC